MPQKNSLGPVAMTILRHLYENGPSTQEELLALVRPKYKKVRGVTVDGKFKAWGDMTREETYKYLDLCDAGKMTSTYYQGEGNPPYTPKDRWGNAYFLPKPAPGFYGGSDIRASLVAKGLIAKTGAKKGRAFTYTITAKGMARLAGWTL